MNHSCILLSMVGTGCQKINDMHIDVKLNMIFNKYVEI